MKTTGFPGTHSSIAATVPLQFHLEALREADKALEASLKYDDPMSSAIAAARNSVRLAAATPSAN